MLVALKRLVCSESSTLTVILDYVRKVKEVLANESEL